MGASERGGWLEQLLAAVSGRGSYQMAAPEMLSVDSKRKQHAYMPLEACVRMLPFIRVTYRFDFQGTE